MKPSAKLLTWQRVSDQQAPRLLIRIELLVHVLLDPRILELTCKFEPRPVRCVGRLPDTDTEECFYLLDVGWVGRPRWNDQLFDVVLDRVVDVQLLIDCVTVAPFLTEKELSVRSLLTTQQVTLPSAA